jgi:WXG100 family type VII secretion target
MADRIEADYDVLAEIQRRFTQVADDVQQMSKEVNTRSQTLREQGWQGKGSDAFYQEMSDDVAPALARLRQALERAGSIVGDVVKTVREAEEQAQGGFGAGRR